MKMIILMMILMPFFQTLAVCPTTPVKQSLLGKGSNQASPVRFLFARRVRENNDKTCTFEGPIATAYKNPTPSDWRNVRLINTVDYVDLEAKRICELYGMKGAKNYLAKETPNGSCELPQVSWDGLMYDIWVYGNPNIPFCHTLTSITCFN
ncbi:MAG: hypothetical protein K9K67_08285 [Bacteriovoracaceae bacterium]|nr:hypothetical protein [Bacteriovoracaceae bacterium]